MPRVIVTAKVEDLTKWEEGFRSHGDLFRDKVTTRPVGYGFGEGNEVCVCFEPERLSDLMEFLQSPAAAESMAHDGVIRETVKLFVLDKELRV